MNGNELLQPVAGPEAQDDRVSIDLVSNEANISPAEEFVYQRKDGTVEVAANAEEAMRRCPVLGAMSVEQANVMLELSSIGNDKMEEEKQRRQEQARIDELATRTSTTSEETANERRSA